MKRLKKTSLNLNNIIKKCLENPLNSIYNNFDAIGFLLITNIFLTIIDTTNSF